MQIIKKEDIKNVLNKISKRKLGAVAAALVVAITLLTGFSAPQSFDSAEKEDIVVTVKSLRKKTASADGSEDSYESRVEQAMAAYNSDNGIFASTFSVNIQRIQDVAEIYVTAGITAEEAVISAGVELDADDVIDIGRDTVLTESCNITVTDVEFVTETAVKTVPFVSRKIYDSKSTSTVITRKGKNGTAEVTTVKRYENGVYVGVESTSEKVITAATDEVVKVGTKSYQSTAASGTAGKGTAYDKTKAMSNLVPTINLELDANGIPVNYKKHVTVQATAYTAPAGARCSTGVVADVGYIAVNPKVIPYGTKMYIVSSDGNWVYGYAVAADTGGFIKRRPTNVDLYMSSNAQCVKFGRRNVEIYILE